MVNKFQLWFSNPSGCRQLCLLNHILSNIFFMLYFFCFYGHYTVQTVHVAKVLIYKSFQKNVLIWIEVVVTQCLWVDMMNIWFGR